jgi:hypothetical protein
VIAFAKRWKIRRLVYLLGGSAAPGARTTRIAASKVEAERLVVESGPRLHDLRLALVYGPGGRGRSAASSRACTASRSCTRSRAAAARACSPSTSATWWARSSSSSPRPRHAQDLQRLGRHDGGHARARGSHRGRGGHCAAARAPADGALPAGLPHPLAAAARRGLHPRCAARLGRRRGPSTTRVSQEECGYAPLTLEQGFARVFGGGEAVR